MQQNIICVTGQICERKKYCEEMTEKKGRTTKGLLSLVHYNGIISEQSSQVMADVEETLKRIQSQKNVAGVIIMDSSGIALFLLCLVWFLVMSSYKYCFLGRAIRSTLDDEATQQHCILLHQLCDKSKSVIRELDGSDDLTFLRLRTKKHEIMIAPDKNFLLAVIQNVIAQI
uniref:Roadblock/LAMTOR2 domain-containing protein n=1 Tax=Setaria digitata TaxID=48799 RepID=A0A915PLE8_9BILA